MKADLKKQIPSYGARRHRFDIVAVPPLQYLMIDGRGDPNTAPAYAAAVSTLFPVAYRIKFMSRSDFDRDYTVMPLEAQWWADDMTAFTTARDKSQWNWTVLNLVPEWITPEHVTDACEQVSGRGRAPALDDLRLERLDEGLVVQTLHLGTYEDEGPVLERMHAQFIPENALARTGKHHEIYLNDARRTAPEKLRTILRQPVSRIG